MNNKIHLLFSLLLLTIFSLNVVSAYEIKTLPNVKIVGDFVLNQAKIELDMNPGDRKIKNIEIINRTEDPKKFKVTVEDTGGSEDGSQAVNLYGDEVGPYSLKDYVSPEIREFILNPREQISLPVTISIPEDAEPGGKYGSVLIESGNMDKSEKVGGARTISRLGALLFVRVIGNITEVGNLKSFSTDRDNHFFITNKNPIHFTFKYQNIGNVHTNPYGVIKIKNIYGANVGEVEVLPYYSMPSSVRVQDAQWSHTPLFGRYVATLELNRGYGDNVDTMSTTLWFIPWLWIFIGFIGLFIFVALFKLVTSRFEFKKK